MAKTSACKFIVFLFAAIFSLNISYPAQREARGIWLAFLDWTSPRYESAQKKWMREVIDNLKKTNMNMVFFQVRARGDAFYRSSYEPWSATITGEMGKDPGWDPLQYMIQQAHSSGIEVHAWVNVFVLWTADSPPSDTSHAYYKHPDWFCVDKSGRRQELPDDIYLSPGIPDVQEYLHNIAMEIVQNYDVDGIHFDYIRYPSAVYSWDWVSRSRWKDPAENPDNLSYPDWQREQINTFVRNFYTHATSVKPMLKLSAAVIGKYNHPETGWDGYNQVYQDAKKWMQEKSMDFLVPMLYWPIGQQNPWAPFEILLREWVKENSFGRQILAGIGAYRYIPYNFKEISNEIDTSRVVGASGEVFFRYGSLVKGELWDDLSYGKYRYPANIPAMTWKDSVPPNPPDNLTAVDTVEGKIILSWSPPSAASDGDTAAYYNIYRAANRPINGDEWSDLRAITTSDDTVYTDSRVESGNTYHYIVTALDKADNESGLSNEVIIRLTGVAPITKPVVKDFRLRQNYPNPFNSETTIEVDIPEGGKAELVIYNI
ncbi:MAG: glycoside hydrolase family 10 protein, partial [Fidelibacterota bacterium]